MLPAGSNTAATGRFSTAAAAGPPSPAKPRVPVPQTSSSWPVAASIVLIRLVVPGGDDQDGRRGLNVTCVGWLSRFVVGSSDAGAELADAGDDVQRAADLHGRVCARWLFQSTTYSRPSGPTVYVLGQIEARRQRREIVGAVARDAGPRHGADQPRRWLCTATGGGGGWIVVTAPDRGGACQGGDRGDQTCAPARSASFTASPSGRGCSSCRRCRGCRRRRT